MGGVSECVGASLVVDEASWEVLVGNEIVWAGVEGVPGGKASESAGVVEDVVGEDGWGVGGDDAGASGGSGSSEAICCCTCSSSAGNDVEGSWCCACRSSGREPSRSR